MYVPAEPGPGHVALLLVFGDWRERRGPRSGGGRRSLSALGHCQTGGTLIHRGLTTPGGHQQQSQLVLACGSVTSKGCRPRSAERSLRGDQPSPARVGGGPEHTSQDLPVLCLLHSPGGLGS